MLRQIMIDIETLGNTPMAPILSIGAVVFDPMTGETYEEFLVNIDFESAMYNRNPDPSTFKWWLEQSKEAQDALTSRKTENIVTALKQLHKWCEDSFKGQKFNDRKVWANDPDFDCTILETAFKQFNMTAPWPFWGKMSCRTVCAIVDGVYRRYNFTREGTHHDALADCKYQVEYISTMWAFARNKILGKA